MSARRPICSTLRARRVLAAALLLLLAPPALATQASGGDEAGLEIRRHMVLAQYLETQERNAKLAAREYRAILRLDPAHREAALGLARIAQQQGDAEAAVKRLEKLAGARGDDPLVWTELGSARKAAGSAEGALAAWEKATEVGPDHAEAHRRAFLALRRRWAAGDEAARKPLRAHLEAYLEHAGERRGPHFATARRLLAELEGGRLGVIVFDAHQAYDRAWSQDVRQDINRLMGQARQGFERCLDLDPGNQECIHGLGQIFASVKASEHYDPAKARAMFEKADRRPDAQVELAIIARKQGAPREALGALQRAVDLDPEHQRAWLELGVVHKLEGRDEAAIEALVKAFRIDPSSSLASEAVGELSLLAPEHALVQTRVRYGSIDGDVFSSEKFKSAVAMFERRFGGVDREAPEQQVLEAVLERILSRADVDTRHSFRIAVLDTPMINAFAMPNGHIYFTKGFFRFMRKSLPERPLDVDHAPLAHVLAHEIVHVLRQHVVRSEVFRHAVSDASKRLDPGVLVHVARIHEIEADREGMVLAALAGYHPRGGIEFMEARGKEREIPPHLDHPTYDERIHYLEEYWSNDVKYAWMSFRFGLRKMDEAAEAQAGDLARARSLYRGAVEDFTRFNRTLRPTRETLNNVGIAWARLGIFRLTGPDNPLHTWNTRFSVERDLAMQFVEIREAEPAAESTDAARRTRGAEGRRRRYIPRELKQAVKAFRSALQKDPGYDKARLNLALCYLAMDKADEAREQVASVDDAEAAEPGDVDNVRGIVEAERGREDDALSAFERAREHAPTRAAATWNTARLHERAGREDDAREAFEEYLELAPKGPWADAARKAVARL
ncbi:MAG: tetratricopeptide repeat protein [Myxococcota bacterium]